MEEMMKPVATLSNTTKSSGNGIPSAVSAEGLEADFVLHFFENAEKPNSTPPRGQVAADLYSTIVG